MRAPRRYVSSRPSTRLGGRRARRRHQSCPVGVRPGCARLSPRSLRAGRRPLRMGLRARTPPTLPLQCRDGASASGRTAPHPGVGLGVSRAKLVLRGARPPDRDDLPGVGRRESSCRPRPRQPRSAARHDRGATHCRSRPTARPPTVSATRSPPGSTVEARDDRSDRGGSGDARTRHSRRGWYCLRSALAELERVSARGSDRWSPGIRSTAAASPSTTALVRSTRCRRSGSGCGGDGTARLEFHAFRRFDLEGIPGNGSFSRSSWRLGTVRLVTRRPEHPSEFEGRNTSALLNLRRSTCVHRAFASHRRIRRPTNPGSRLPCLDTYTSRSSHASGCFFPPSSVAKRTNRGIVRTKDGRSLPNETLRQRARLEWMSASVRSIGTRRRSKHTTRISTTPIRRRRMRVGTGRLPRWLDAVIHSGACFRSRPSTLRIANRTPIDLPARCLERR